jgi:hypothetical protein
LDIKKKVSYLCQTFFESINDEPSLKEFFKKINPLFSFKNSETVVIGGLASLDNPGDRTKGTEWDLAILGSSQFVKLTTKQSIYDPHLKGNC